MDSRIPFRIRIGVSGHRKLPDENTLSEKTQQVLSLLTEVIQTIKDGKKFKNTNQPLKKDIYDLFDKDSRKAIYSSPGTPITFSILTPLAEGADRLVARNVLKFPDSRIEVVLPLTKEDYLEDFETEKSKHEFEELLNKARRPITLKKYLLKEEYRSEDLAESRRQAYKAVGQYVVNHCDILIALWDGEPSRGKGGTAEIVEYAAKRKRPVIIISTGGSREITVKTGHGLNARSIQQIEMFNTYPLSLDTQTEYVDNMYKETFYKKEEKKFPEDARALIKENLLPYYARASILAKWYQKLYLWTGTVAYSLSALAIAAVATGILNFSLSFYAFLLEFLLLVTIFSFVTFANHKKAHKKWVENRFLAERIRSARFFVACGVEMLPIEIPPYMGVAHQPDDWMIRVFHEIWNRLPALKGCKTLNPQQLNAYIRRHWVQDQIKYHKKKKTTTGGKSKILEWTGYVLFLIAMTVAITHAISHFQVHELHRSLLNDVLTFFAIVLPVTGAVIGGIRSHREYSRLEKRSNNMEVVLKDLKERYSQILRLEELESLLRETDELMLRETQDWLMLMRFVELKPEA